MTLQKQQRKMDFYNLFRGELKTVARTMLTKIKMASKKKLNIPREIGNIKECQTETAKQKDAITEFKRRAQQHIRLCSRKDK